MSLFQSLYTLSPQKAYRYFAHRNRLARTDRIISKYLDQHTHRKLQIGCGGNFLAGWLNSDLVPYSKSVALIDAARPFPIPDKTFDVVYSEHVFEHLDGAGQVNYLKECKRILMPGGKIRIATPDFDFLLALTKNDLNEIQKEHLRFHADNFVKAIPVELLNSSLPLYVINNYVRDWGHQLIHNKKSLAEMVQYFGFTKVTFHEVGESKMQDFQNIERHAEMIGVELNKLETMIIEAEG